MDEPIKCDAEAAGYDGMFGIYCELPKGHDGLHDDGYVRWEFVIDNEITIKILKD